MSSYNILGIMSGTSMDGVDISFCTYNLDDNQQWTYRFHSAETFPYNPELLNFLKNSKDLGQQDLLLLDKAIGKFFSICIEHFITEKEIDRNQIDLIASHGHTVFHRPELGYTYQIGCGDTIAYNTKIPVVNDFRQKDVVAGGQGAPLVPIGDLKLFSLEADTFLNIGGFANISTIQSDVKAFDISPGNLPLNLIVSTLGLEFDDQGKIARSGSIDEALLDELDRLPFYQKAAPKSLGTEWLDKEFMSIIARFKNAESALSTTVEHISKQISNVINSLESKRVLITGGGAKNNYLIESIQAKTNAEIIVPEEYLIDFKESIVFGFLGALHQENQPNCLSSVTGARENVTGGVYHTP